MFKEILRSKLFRAGAALLLAGASPLLLYILYEFVSGRRGGNPIGLGLLFFVSFWPAVLLLVIGAVSGLRRYAGGAGKKT